jgi:hypothetical protein
MMICWQTSALDFITRDNTKRAHDVSRWFLIGFILYIYMKKMKINNKVKAIAIPTAKAKIWRKMS